jgi:hypothetical protein
VRIALIDDQILGSVLRGQPPEVLASRQLFTTGHWYVRLCQAVLGSQGRPGTLSRPFIELAPDLRTRALGAAMKLPADIGLLSLRDLGPTIAELRQHHRLNILGIEALAAASRLRAQVFLSASSPILERALGEAKLHVEIRPPGQPD